MTFYTPKRKRITYSSDKPSRTKQSFKQETDINNIMKRWEKTGVIEHQNKYAGGYGDFSDFIDFQSSLNQVVEAEAMFLDLPASVRKRFGNDPLEFLNFATNPENGQELVKLGLAKAREGDVARPQNAGEDPSAEPAKALPAEKKSASPAAP